LLVLSVLIIKIDDLVPGPSPLHVSNVPILHLRTISILSGILTEPGRRHNLLGAAFIVPLAAHGLLIGPRATRFNSSLIPHRRRSQLILAAKVKDDLLLLRLLNELVLVHIGQLAMVVQWEIILRDHLHGTGAVRRSVLRVCVLGIWTIVMDNVIVVKLSGSVWWAVNVDNPLAREDVYRLILVES
jgi:hypothetical protein